MKLIHGALFFIAATIAAHAKDVPLSDLSLAANATEAQAKKFLRDVRRAVDAEMEHVRLEARATGTSQLDPSVTTDAEDKVDMAIPSHLRLVCEAAISAERDNIVFFGAAMQALTKRKNYASAQKAILVEYLPKLPRLITVLQRMQWLEGADTAIAAGWKKASKDERDGMLTWTSSPYANIAAHRGVTDALVAVAKTVRNPKADTRKPAKLLQDEIATLKALVPLESSDPTALAEFVLKNKPKLTFDPAKSAYIVAK